MVLALTGFALAGLLRAGSGYVAERAAFAAGAGARRRLRTDIVTRLARARPLLERGRHSAELTAIVVDRIEALDGLFVRYIPATVLAVASPVIVAVVAAALDPVAGLILA
ncbi:MAG TPA: thiol reductant ABC exporter subunit CydD, partial [Acetobacteraceae bacterium]|nr:thiol reductant ABC exporter subunit CydD [Acetobacteraceae bacterium]